MSQTQRRFDGGRYKLSSMTIGELWAQEGVDLTCKGHNTSTCSVHLLGNDCARQRGLQAWQVRAGRCMLAGTSLGGLGAPCPCPCPSQVSNGNLHVHAGARAAALRGPWGKGRGGRLCLGRSRLNIAANRLSAFMLSRVLTPVLLSCRATR